MVFTSKAAKMLSAGRMASLPVSMASIQSLWEVGTLTGVGVLLKVSHSCG